MISSNFCLLQERCYLPSLLPRLTLLKATSSTRHLIIYSVLPSVIGRVLEDNRRDYNIVRVSSFASKELS